MKRHKRNGAEQGQRQRWRAGNRGLHSRSLYGLMALAALSGPSAAAAQEGAAVSSSDAARCQQGAVSTIEVRNGSVFDPAATSSRSLRWAFGLANALHMRTRESFILDELLVAPGDCASPVLLRESERLLEAYPTLRDVRVEARPDGARGQRLVVTTWDEWSTHVDVRPTWDSGANIEKAQVTERNLLGRAMFAQYTYRRRREISEQSLGLSTPRFLGRANLGVTIGRRRAGDFYYQALSYPFVGEVGRTSLWQHHERGEQFFSWATAGATEASHVLVGVTTERTELSAARQFGVPGELTITGLALVRERVAFDERAGLTRNDNFDEREEVELPDPVRAQLEPIASLRLEARVGWRRFAEYRRFDRLDNMGPSAPIPLGWFASLSLGRSLPGWAPGPREQAGGTFVRSHAALTRPLGSGGLLHVTGTIEARRTAGRWRDVLGQSDAVLYAPLHRAQTLFLRGATAFGQQMSRPFQLSLGGREGVRSLPDDALPGGRMVRFTLEDRIHPEFTSFGALDVGATLFADVGRMWAAEVPFGVDSGWQVGVGAGLRLAAPSGSRNVTRFDLVLPVGASEGGPMLRITAEMNTMGSGFGTPRLLRSLRMLRAAEHH